MFPFSAMGLQKRVWDDFRTPPGGWSVYTVGRDGALHFSAGHPNRFPIPGRLVEYWVPPGETDWRVIIKGLLEACEASGRITLY